MLYIQVKMFIYEAIYIQYLIDLKRMIKMLIGKVYIYIYIYQKKIKMLIYNVGYI